MLPFNRVSPTAIYTAQVWQKHGRSFEELSLPLGPLFYNAMWPAMTASRMVGSPTLEDFLLARHDLIDHHLHEFVKQGGTHVIELASGYSPRGMRFIREYGSNVYYTDTDLPDMAANKDKRLSQFKAANPNYAVKPVDAFAVDGEHSLSYLIKQIPADKPVAVVAEGLLNYFSPESLAMLFNNLGSAMKGRPHCLFVSDIHVQSDNQGPLAEAFVQLLSAFVRGRVHLHYKGQQQAKQALRKAGLTGELLKPSAFADQYESCQAKWADLVSILVARPESF